MRTIFMGALLGAGLSVHAASLPPGLRGHYPVDGATGVAPNSAILLRTEPGIRPAASLEGVDTGERIEMVITFSFDTGLVLKPTKELATSTRYRARILLSRAASPEYSFQFTTGTTRDVEGPRITGLEPPPGSTAVGLVGPVIIRFSEPVIGGYAVHVNGSSLYTPELTPDNLGVVVRLENNTAASFDLLIDPNQFRDLADNRGQGTPIAARYLTFLASGARGPVLQSFYPLSGQQNVPTNTAINLRFETPVSESTLSQGVRIEGPAGPIAFSAATLQLSTGVIIRPVNILQPNTTYRVILTTALEDQSRIPLAGNQEFTFTTGTAPELSSTSSLQPFRADSPVPRNTVLHLRGNRPFAPVAPTVNAVELADNRISGDVIPVKASFDETATILSIAPAGLWKGKTQYRVTIEGLFDNTGVPIYDSGPEFRTSDEIDTMPPTLLNSWPQEGASGVLLDEKITLEFSEPLGSFIYLDPPITLLDNAGNVVAAGGTIHLGGAPQIQFIYPRKLEPGKTYTIHIEGLTDVAGNRISPTERRFTTGTASASGTPPKLVRSDPADLAQNVSTTAPIVLDFDVPVRLANLGASAWLVSDSDVIPVRIEVNGATVRAVPVTELVADTSAQFNIQVVAPSGRESSQTIRFTTGSSADRVRPQIVRADPAPGAILRSGERITVYFSKPIAGRNGPAPLVLFGSGGAQPFTAMELSADSTNASFAVPGDFSGPLTIVPAPWAKDRAGNLIVPWTGEYTVVPAVQMSGPFAVQSRPATDSRFPYVEIPGDVSLTWFFSGNLKLEDIEQTWFVLENGAPVPGRWDYNTDSQALQFFPSRRFASGSRIQLFERSPANIGGSVAGWFVITEPAPDAPLQITRWQLPDVDGGVMEFELSADTTPDGDLISIQRNLNGGLETVPAEVTRIASRRFRIAPKAPLGPPYFYFLYAGPRVAGFRNSAGTLDASVSMFRGTPAASEARQPAILAVGPPAGELNVGVNARVVITFDEPINVLTIRRDNIRIRAGEQSVPLLFTVADNRRSVTATPVGVLPGNARIDVEVTGVEDQRGRKVPARNWSFSTANTSDLTGPKVISRTTQRGESSIELPPTASYEIRFDEPVSPDFLRSATVGGEFDFEISLSEDLRTLTLRPRTPLPAGGAVAFNLPNPTDLAGNAGPLDGIYYKVAIAADAGPVRLVSSLPENGSKGIARNARFILTFDKPVPAAAAAAVSLLRGNEAVPLTVLSRDNLNQLVFSSIRPLAADTTYRLTIGALNSFSGAIYEGPAEISFSTSDAVSF